MKWFYRIILLILFLGLVITGGVYYRYHHLLHSRKAENILTEYLQRTLQHPFEYETFELSIWPAPQATFEGLVFSNQSSSQAVTAKKIEIKFDLIKLFWGRAQIAGLRLEKGEYYHSIKKEGVEAEIVKFDNILLKTERIVEGEPVELYLQADALGVEKLLVLNGSVFIPSLDAHYFLKNMDFNFEGKIKNLNLKSVLSQDMVGSKIKLQQGILNTEFEMSKKMGSGDIDISAQGKLKKFIYEVLDEGEWRFSPEAMTQFHVNTKWNLWKKTILFQGENSVIFPISELKFQGEYSFKESSFNRFHVTAVDLKLDQIFDFYPPMHKWIPVNLGFSGLGTFSMIFDGDLDDIRVFLDSDLTEAYLNYSKFIQKDRAIPFFIKGDIAVSNQRSISGDIAFESNQSNIKGSITEYDWIRNKGQINIISNKLSLEEIYPLLTFLEDYDVRGKAKVLANFDGNFKDRENMESIFNFVISDAFIKSKESESGLGIEELVLDYGDLMIEGHNMSLQIGEDNLLVDLLVKRGDSSKATLNIESDEVNPVEMFNVLESLNIPKNILWDPLWLSQLSHLAKTIFSEGDRVQSLSSEFHSEEEMFAIKEVRFDIFSGKIAMRGAVGFGLQKDNQWIEIHGKGLELGNLLARDDDESHLITGSLDFQSYFDGFKIDGEHIFKNVSGYGSLSVSDGNIHVIKWAEILSHFDFFKDQELSEGDNLSFDEIRSEWVFEVDKFTLESMFLEGPRWQGEGSGALSNDGFINLRMNLSLEEVFAQEYLKDDAVAIDQTLFSNNGFGPLSILLSGKSDELVAKVEPQSILDLSGFFEIPEIASEDLDSADTQLAI